MAFRLDPAADLPEEVARAASEQLQTALTGLAAARDDHATGIHAARKALKKLRALLRLVRKAEPGFCRAENVRYRDVARSIAGPREASALVETVDRFIAEHPDAIASASLDLIRRRLDRRRERIGADAGHLDAAIEAAMRSCHGGRGALRANGFANVDLRTLARGARATLGQWKKAQKAARRRGADDDFHELRKAVKAHWTHLGLLQNFWTRDVSRRRERADALGERLGELNDIAVMQDLLDGNGIDLGSDVDTAPFRKLLRRKAKALRKASLKESEALLKQRPRRLATAFRRAVSRA